VPHRHSFRTVVSSGPTRTIEVCLLNLTARRTGTAVDPCNTDIMIGRLEYGQIVRVMQWIDEPAEVLTGDAKFH
jgi:hypothetical protein